VLDPAHLGGWEVVDGQRVDGCGESSPHGGRRGLCYQCGRHRPTSWSHSELVAGSHLGAGPCRPTRRGARIAKPSRAQDAVTMLEGRRARSPRAGPARRTDLSEPRGVACGARVRRDAPAHRTPGRHASQPWVGTLPSAGRRHASQFDLVPEFSRRRVFRRNPWRGNRRRRPTGIVDGHGIAVEWATRAPAAI
jgi:hypothetical protein